MIQFHASATTDVIHSLPKLVISLGGTVPSYEKGYTKKSAIEESVLWIIHNPRKIEEYQLFLREKGTIDYTWRHKYLCFNHTGGYSYIPRGDSRIVVFPCLRGKSFTAISWQQADNRSF